MRQALALPSHLIAIRLMIHGAIGIAVTSYKNRKDGEICRKLAVPCGVGTLLARPQTGLDANQAVAQPLHCTMLLL